MKAFVALALAVVCTAPHAHAEPKRRFNNLVFENSDPSSPRFEFKQEVAACARPMAAEDFTVEPGQEQRRRYYEKLFEDDCILHLKRFRWLVTASRPRDNFRWQCRVGVVNRMDLGTQWWRVRVETESAQPVAPGTADLCTDGTLVKSAVCDTTDETSFEKADCLNRNTDLHGKITITLGGPPIPPSPASELINPLTTPMSD